MAARMAKLFLFTALFFYLLGCAEGLMFGSKFQLQSLYQTVLHIPPEHLKAFFGSFVTKIHTHVNLVGWVSSAIMGILYFVAPQISGRECYRPWSCYANWATHVLGVLLIAIGFHFIGIIGLPSGYAAGSPEFRALVAPYKLFVVAGGISVTVSALLFSWNVGTALAGKKSPSPA
jgi:heme/copper-type cytochrome/quinol oxidase subunit 1